MPKSDKYSPQFLVAWDKYPHCKKPYRSGKAASQRAWRSLKLDDHIDNVVSWIEDTVVGDKWTKGFQVWLKMHDLTSPPPGGDKSVETTESTTSEAPSGPVLADHDWGLTISLAKVEALRRKMLHPRNPYLYPETINLAARDIASGREKGPPTVERTLEIAQMRADRIKASVRRP